MTRTVRAVMAFALSALALAIGGCDPAARPSCVERASADAAKVRTDRHWTDADLPGVGDYRQIHWQIQTLGDPCGAAPGPNDWAYQGVLELAPQDMNALAEQWNWAPAADGPEALWPDLAQYTAKSAQWWNSSTYDSAVRGTQQTRVFIDVVHDTLLVQAHTT